jgi:hypothetical protein
VWQPLFFLSFFWSRKQWWGSPNRKEAYVDILQAESYPLPFDKSFSLRRNVTVLDRNRTEQGGAHNYLVPDPQLLGSGPQVWFLIIGSSYFTTTRSGPMDDS